MSPAQLFRKFLKLILLFPIVLAAATNNLAHMFGPTSMQLEGNL